MQSVLYFTKSDERKMIGSIDELHGVPPHLTRRIPVSLEGVVAVGPEFVNHGKDYDRWRLLRPDGTPVGQVRVYQATGAQGREAVYIPPRETVHQCQFSLPYAQQFSAYLRAHLEAYLLNLENTIDIDRALRSGPTIVGVAGMTYFLRWNVYFNDEKIGQYTVHDMDNEKAKGDIHAHNGERTYKGRIPGYTNPHVVAWNEVQQSSLDPNLLGVDEVVLRWARLPGNETPDNRYPIVWKRGDFLDIPFP